MEPYKKLTGPWTLKNANFTKDAGKVFSCFSCTGGSTMGYKLAGFDVIGFNEIDPRVAHIYKLNHKPKFGFVCSIRDIIDKPDLPEEMFNLDILDGSPPCSSFSTSGKRHKLWGKKKKFAEGQQVQRLDDLFFEFIALAKRLQPKIVVAENVKGIVSGKARGYVKEIFQGFNDANYDIQLFLLNAANMGVPQARPRVFFVGKRKDLELPKIKLSFNEKPISMNEAFSHIQSDEILKRYYLSDTMLPHWKKTKVGTLFSKWNEKKNYFNWWKLNLDEPCKTLTATDCLTMPYVPRHMTIKEAIMISTFPTDMNWDKWTYTKKKWAMGMSVPPFMTQRIALQIKKQWIEVLNGSKK